MYGRLFEKKDIDAVMHIWLSSNLWRIPLFLRNTGEKIQQRFGR